ncbi:Sporulation thiol-disulfide oxidoreductase A precursor [compost metagenome]
MTLSDYRYIGYDKAFQTNLNLFGEKVKKSDVYKAFILSIKKDLKISEGNIFPKMIFDNKSLDSAFGEKYTLVDFWFSSCIPCLEQIPSYKLTYEKYKNKGFEFIGVSTDRTQNIYNWRGVIKKNNLIWTNFLDENGVQSKVFNIERFPTNYLLDSEGKIINYNISPKELGEFLEQNLH